MPETENKPRISTTIQRGLTRTEYECLGTGKKMCLNNRTVQHQDLHPKTAVQEELFHTSTSLDWQPMTDHSRGMHSIEYGKLPGMVEQGFVTLHKGGLLPLHWHKETEHYVIFRGTAIVQIGDCVREINGDKDPTMVIIPGNTPHQITNKKKEPAMLYYYFPEQETFEEDISYYFPCGKIEPPGSEWLASKGSALGALIGSALIGSTLAAAAPGSEPGGYLRPNGPISERKTSANRGELGPNLFRPSLDLGESRESMKVKLKTKKLNNWMTKIKKIPNAFKQGLQIHA